MKRTGLQRPRLHAEPARASLTQQRELWVEKAMCRVESRRRTGQGSDQYWWSLWSLVVVAQGPSDSNGETWWRSRNRASVRVSYGCCTQLPPTGGFSQQSVLS